MLEEIRNPRVAKFKGQDIEPNFNVERFREIEGLDDLYSELLEESLVEDLELI